MVEYFSGGWIKGHGNDEQMYVKQEKYADDIVAANLKYDALAAELAGCRSQPVRQRLDAALTRIRELEAHAWNLIDQLGRYPVSNEPHQLTAARNFLMGSAAETGAELAKGCHRSHPHEDMDAGCQRLTEIAREANKRANMTETGVVKCNACGSTEPDRNGYVKHKDNCPCFAHNQ
jgi:hypothetical protein